MRVFKKLILFIKKDFLVELSYKTKFVFSVGSVFFSVLTLFFLSEAFGTNIPHSITKYGSSKYFPYVIIGMALIDFMWVGFRSFSANLRFMQIIGALELMFVSKTSVPAIILFSSAYQFVYNGIRISLYFVFAVILYGNFFASANFLSLLIIMVLTFLVFVSIGLISAAITLIIKASDPAVSLVGGLFFLLGGIMYPIEILPETLQTIGKYLPVTLASSGLRLAILKGVPIGQLIPEISGLFIYTLILLPLAIVTINRAFNYLTQEGSTGFY